MLLESGAAVDTQDKQGWSALMLAARVDASALSELLIAHGADTHLQVFEHGLGLRA